MKEKYTYLIPVHVAIFEPKFNRASFFTFGAKFTTLRHHTQNVRWLASKANLSFVNTPLRLIQPSFVYITQGGLTNTASGALDHPSATQHTRSALVIDSNY